MIEKVGAPFSEGLPMRTWPRSHLFPGILAGLFVLLTTTAAHAQNSKPARFPTADGVEIQGTFWPGAKKDATVMLLHAVGKGEDSHKKGWDSLGDALNAKGYAVLSFDVRGHGQSTTVDPRIFWALNRQNVKQGANPNSFEFKQILKSGYPALVNDIAAAKAFLDRRNDAGECNASSLILVGAETGATLGAIWLNSEYNRYELLPPVQFGAPPVAAKDPEGKNTIAAVWLSISPKLGDRTVSPAATLALPFSMGTQQYCLYADDDKEGKSVAKGLETLKKKLEKVDQAKYQFSLIVPVTEAKGLKGLKLLSTGGLGIKDAIVKYADNLIGGSKGNEYVNRNFNRAQFIWVGMAPRPMPTQNPDKSYVFSMYLPYIKSQ
jgi:pimeloyl-ACP methyl ester carboxylesterase